MSDNEKLAAELKAIADSMKSMGQYTQDLQRAMSNMLRPMQEMSDYMKATAKASEESQEANKKLLDDLGATVGKMGEIAQAVKERNKNSEDSNKLSEERLRLHQQQEERIKKQQEDQKKLSEIDKERNRELDLANKSAAAQKNIWSGILDLIRDQEKASAKLGYELDKNGQLVAKYNAEWAKTKAYTGGMQAMTGGSSAAGLLGQIGSGINSLMPALGPVGGLIGMIVYGVNQDEHFRSVGEKASQIFDQVGGHSHELTGQLAGAARTLSKWGIAAEGDLLAVSAALTQMGVSGAEAKQKMEGLVGIAGTNLVTAMLAADKAFEMTSGTMAQMAGSLARDFNMPILEAATSMTNLGTAAASAGFNAQGMMQSAMQAASALRLLNANGQDVGATMFGLSKGMAGAGFNNQFSQQYSQAGMTSATGAIAGMGVGMSAIIGERLGYGSGLDAWYKMKSPKGRDADDKLDVGDIMGQMRGIVQELSPNRSEQAYALTKLFGVDVSGADAILDAMKEQAETGTLSAESLEKINTAFASEGDKANRLLQSIEVIKDAVAKVSVGLLQIIANSLKLLYDGIMFGFYSLMALMPTGDKDYASAMAATYLKDIKSDWGNVKSGVNAIKGALIQAETAGGVAVGTFSNAMHWSSSEAERDALSAKTAGTPATPTEKAVGKTVGKLPGVAGGLGATLMEAALLLMRAGRQAAANESPEPNKVQGN